MSQGFCSSPFKSAAPVIKTKSQTQTVQHFSDPMIEFLETFTLLERWMVIPIDIPIQIPIASPIGGGGCPIDIPIDIPIQTSIASPIGEGGCPIDILIDIPIQIPIGSPIGGARCPLDIARDIPIALPRGGGGEGKGTVAIRIETL